MEPRASNFSPISNKALVGAFIPWSYNHPKTTRTTRQHLGSHQLYSPSDDQLERTCLPKNHNVETLSNIPATSQVPTRNFDMGRGSSRLSIPPGGLWKTFVRGTGISIPREPAPTTRLTLEHRQPLHCCSLASALSKSQVTTRKHRHSQCLPATKVNHNRQFDARRWLLSTGDEEILPESHMKILTAFSLKELKGDYWLVVVQNLRSLKNSVN